MELTGLSNFSISKYSVYKVSTRILMPFVFKLAADLFKLAEESIVTTYASSTMPSALHHESCC